MGLVAKLRKRRESMRPKVTQAELARRLGMSREMFSKYELGKAEAGEDLLVRWAKELGYWLLLVEIPDDED